MLVATPVQDSTSASFNDELFCNMQEHRRARIPSQSPSLDSHAQGANWQLGWKHNRVSRELDYRNAKNTNRDVFPCF